MKKRLIIYPLLKGHDNDLILNFDEAGAIVDRRNFLHKSFIGMSALVVGTSCSKEVKESFISPIEVTSLKFRITGAMKEMATHNDVNDARCYFWIFKEENLPSECPGPAIVTTHGERISVTVTNDLDEPHAFFIKDVVDSGPIAPGETKRFTFTAPVPGSYLYYDHLNAPVNRIMGLHGALIVMPRNLNQKSTPYLNPTREVRNLFDDLGDVALFPGLAWGQGDPKTNTPPFRQYLWLLHEVSPVLFEEVGNFTPGKDYPADKFRQAFTQDPYANTFETGKFNRKPHFFTINGQSGHFAHHNPYITPCRRVGEPVVIRVLNAGIYSHSLHFHANHYFVTSVNNVIQDNLLWLDTFSVHELEGFDFVYPFRRPPDIPNEGGRGFGTDRPLRTMKGKPVWPPVEEMNVVFRPENFNETARMSPLCYPMHDHIEPSQTAQGANYPTGMICGAFFTGDRNTPGFQNFPEYPHEFDVDPLSTTDLCAPMSPHSHNPQGRPQREESDPRTVGNSHGGTHSGSHGG